MQRIFPGLAVTAGVLLAASFMLGFIAGQGGRDRGHSQYDLHSLVGLVATAATILTHAVTFTYLLSTGKRVKEIVRIRQLPEWLNGIATRNRRRALPFELVGVLLIGATACLGVAVDMRYGFPSIWHLLLASAAIGFQLGAFLVEYISIISQTRFRLEIEGQADLAQAGTLNSECEMT